MGVPAKQPPDFTAEKIPSSHRPAIGSGAVSAAAAAMLVLMGVLMFASAWNDSPTSDDNVSIISGYSYLRKQEYRLEPQNPPLIKDLGAFPLLFMKLNEPWAHPGWDKESDPDLLGREFLYKSGNDPDAILRAAKAPMVLFAVAFGGVLFWWTRKQFGGSVALLTLFLYTFSPTFLAHGRFVTTDVSAAAAFFVTTAALLRFLKDPSWRNIALAGLAMGFAFLTKFSTVALVPIALILAVLWVALRATSIRDARALIWTYLPRTLCVIAIAYVVIYPLYLHAVWNYPPELQVSEAKLHRDLYGMHGTAKDIVIWASDKSILRPWAEYFLGLLVALFASKWGQSLFFIGKVYSTGLRVYFPFVYLVKEPLALHVLTLFALAAAIAAGVMAIRRGARLRESLAKHFTEVAILLVLGIYWAALIRSHMNIGVRHLLPAFPLTYILVSRQIVEVYGKVKARSVAAWAFRISLGALLAWQAITVVRVYPSYIAYFNELAGGPNGGWRYVNDSNLDWGQELKRLSVFMDQRGITGIHLDFFGPLEEANYYLQGRFLGSMGCAAPPKGWVAVSAMVYPGAPWNPACDYHRFLPIEKAVARIGYSIFVFYVD